MATTKTTTNTNTKTARKAPAKRTRKAPTPPKKGAEPAAASAETSALLKMIESMQAKIEQLSKGSKKAQAKARDGRTMSEIFDGIKLPTRKQDWRTEWHEDCRDGYRIEINKFDIDKKTGDVILRDDLGTVSNVIGTMPRDSDVGGHGTQARVRGLLALHWELAEDGESYLGMPSYVSEEELATLIVSDAWT